MSFTHDDPIIRLFADDDVGICIFPIAREEWKLAKDGWHTILLPECSGVPEQFHSKYLDLACITILSETEDTIVLRLKPASEDLAFTDPAQNAAPTIEPFESMLSDLVALEIVPETTTRVVIDIRKDEPTRLFIDSSMGAELKDFLSDRNNWIAAKSNG